MAKAEQVLSESSDWRGLLAQALVRAPNTEIAAGIASLLSRAEDPEDTGTDAPVPPDAQSGATPAGE
ncbi:hypothetical protein [uncultured Novosphingobium sp.]|uniref:hypothetical protein n=1 Tax=uncultured Novosphingobium sp. TaxID=292277 RepID=UPI00374A3B29